MFWEDVGRRWEDPMGGCGRDWCPGICSLQRCQVCCTFTCFALLLNGPPKLGTSLEGWIISVILQISTTAAHWSLGEEMIGRHDFLYMLEYVIISGSRKENIWRWRCNFGWLFGSFMWTRSSCIAALEAMSVGVGGGAIIFKVTLQTLNKSYTEKSRNSKTNQCCFDSEKLKQLFSFCGSGSGQVFRNSFRSLCGNIFSSLCCSLIFKFHSAAYWPAWFITSSCQSWVQQLSSHPSTSHCQQDGFPLAASTASARRHDIMTPESQGITALCKPLLASGAVPVIPLDIWTEKRYKN